MAKVTLETVDRIARLAHLSLSAEERELFTRQLAEILAYADSLQALDAEAVSDPDLQGTGARFRDDTPAPSLQREAVLDAAPDPGDRLFRVPRVIAG